MKRIFYYSDNELRIFHWLKNQCIASFVFRLDMSDLDKFKNYLLVSNKTPVRLLLDLTNEEYTQTTIPHVGSADRKAIIKRKVSRKYPDCKDYIWYKVRGREKSVRKNDILFYSVLSKPDVLNPLLELLKQYHVPVSGIWSLPLLSELLLSKIYKNSTNVLLVSQQVAGSLRLTFFKNNKLISSRSTTIQTNNPSSFQDITREIEQTVRFLYNQGFIGLNEIINVIIISHKNCIVILKSICKSTDTCKYYFFTLEEISKLLRYNSPKTKYCNEIYTCLCSTSSVTSGHYWPHSIFNMYYQKILSATLNAFSFTFIISSIVFSFFYLSEAEILGVELITLNNLDMGIKNEYKLKFSKYENLLLNSQAIESSVLLNQKMTQAESVSLQKIMIHISHSITPSHMHSILFTQFSWQQTQNNSISDMPDKLVSRQTDYTNHKPINYYAKLTGTIINTQNNLPNTRRSFKSIIDNISNINHVLSVEIIQSPFNSASSQELEYETGTNQKKSFKTNTGDSQFVIAIFIRGND